MTNAIINRITHIKDIAESSGFALKVYCLSSYDGIITRLLRNKPKRHLEALVNIEGIDISVVWSKFSLIDYLLVYKANSTPVFEKIDKNFISELSQYDLISAHSFLAGKVAKIVNALHNIPYCVTWHGSDIHTAPNSYSYYRNETIKILENATQNIFVSEALASTSKKLSASCAREVLCNGANEEFTILPEPQRKDLRKKYGLNTDTKVVGFVGNLISLKNALLLPKIFETIQKKFNAKVKFWIIGNGNLRQQIEQEIKKYGLEAVTEMMGNRPYSEMPELMNCIDLLVLPSKNEGLPLVTVEASNCGAMVIGSRAGGIPEAIGMDNTVEPGDEFPTRFADACVSALNGNYTRFVNKKLDWNVTANKEIEIYKKLLSKNA